jgi:hypothetical protein
MNPPLTRTSQLWTVGYGAWPSAVRAERLVGALQGRGITRLVDIRLNPCASGLKPGSYGPKPWTLQAGPAGIVGILEPASIAYEWIVELGNPQRHDPSMSVLRAHLNDVERDWPVHRGLEQLACRIRQPGEVVAILCACADEGRCHRRVIAQALAERAFKGRLVIRDVRTGSDVEMTR